MTYPIATVALKYEDDVVAARQRARHIAQLLGFDSQDQTRIATAVSEIARNAFRYAEHGLVEFLLEGQTSPQVLVIRVTDKGPGIRDLPRILEGRYQSATGMGLGILGAKRLMDQCDVQSQESFGTTVRLKKLVPTRAPLVGAKELQQLVDQLITTPAQSAQEELRQQNHELMRILDELRVRQDELVRMNHELEDTNRGVVALYAELDEKADHLRRADQMKSRFLSNMSHEFRTPLSSILALSALLLDRTDGELTIEQDKQARFIRKAAETLLELVNDLLDLAKIEAGKVDVRPVEFEIKTMFSALRGMLKPLLAGSSVNLVFDDPDGLPLLYTDEGKVSQVVRNFISNALKFTEKGEIRVTASIDALEENITLSVADTGIGIRPEDQVLIFEEFSQVDHPIQRRVKGTGLGLPLCKKLAGLLGGHVTVESQVGIGSTFRLTFPVHHSSRDRLLDTGGGEVAPLDTARFPILIIEDQAETRFIYETYLRGTTYQPICAAGLHQARRLLQGLRPAAIILDILLGGEESWRWLAHMKADEATKDIPIIVVTTVEDHGKGLVLGADAYHVKPIERAALVSELDRLVERRGIVGRSAGNEAFPRLLIIDDDESFRYILKKCLLDLPCTVSEAEDAMAGIRLCRELQPDLIFLDLTMPGRSGWQFLQDLAAYEKVAGTPVVIVTSQALSAEARAVLERSARAIVMKSDLSEERVRRVITEVIPERFGQAADRVQQE
ncbi:MAG: histidine kinase [Nitrospira sp.]|jgi:signal transduction histidine kinase/CheY-like chemotaxis protein|nr:histidine kinase [Nitrospira sp.]